MGSVTELHTRGSQFKPCRGCWNIWSLRNLEHRKDPCFQVAFVKMDMSLEPAEEGMHS